MRDMWDIEAGHRDNNPASPSSIESDLITALLVLLYGAMSGKTRILDDAEEVISKRTGLITSKTSERKRIFLVRSVEA